MDPWVYLPCDSEAWWEDKKLFLLLSHLRSVEEFGALISAHTRQGGERTILSHRLKDLAGLRVFLADHCSPEEKTRFLRSTLPFVAKTASCLDERVPESGIPFLAQQEGIVLGSEFACGTVHGTIKLSSDLYEYVNRSACKSLGANIDRASLQGWASRRALRANALTGQS